jgi:hypothetical protein
MYLYTIIDVNILITREHYPNHIKSVRRQKYSDAPKDYSSEVER